MRKPNHQAKKTHGTGKNRSVWNPGIHHGETGMVAMWNPGFSYAKRPRPSGHHDDRSRSRSLRHHVLPPGHVRMVRIEFLYPHKRRIPRFRVLTPKRIPTRPPSFVRLSRIVSNGRSFTSHTNTPSRPSEPVVVECIVGQSRQCGNVPALWVKARYKARSSSPLDPLPNPLSKEFALLS